jgi:hypothetical protein
MAYFLGFYSSTLCCFESNFSVELLPRKDNNAH